MAKHSVIYLEKMKNIPGTIGAIMQLLKIRFR